MSHPWTDRLRTTMRQKQSLLCCGLDPDLRRIPVEYAQASHGADGVQRFLKRVVDISLPHVCAFKLQKAFFDIHADGLSLLTSVVSYIRSKEPGLPIIVDCKIGDIANTMVAYFDLLFNTVKANAVVLNPYMGSDVWEALPSEKAGLVLVQTSNPSGSLIQEAILSNGMPLWRHVLRIVIDEWERGNDLVPILASTFASNLQGIRGTLPDAMPVFLAGIGAQGGDTRVVRELVDSHREGLLVHSSRALIYPYSPLDPDWEAAVEGALTRTKNEIAACLS